MSRYERLHDNDKPADQRDPGERDRDRVLYTYALRRLAGVTQVVGPTEGQLFHNRLTHTLEVAQIARRLAERFVREAQKRPESERDALLLQIDPDVVETAALVHDLGHPPFGHIAEEELDDLAERDGAADGFEGNAQSFRIVTKLAPHFTKHPGLNLTRASLRAILKYPWLRAPKPADGAAEKPKEYKKYGAYSSETTELDFAKSGSASNEQSLEAAIMDYADGVAYSVHDVDDFYRAGLIHVTHLQNDPKQLRKFLNDWVADGRVTSAHVDAHSGTLDLLLKDTFALKGPYQGTREERIQLSDVFSNLIKQFVTSVELQASPAGVYSLRVDPVIDVQLRFLQRLLWVFVISSPRLATQQHGQRQVIRNLYAVYRNAVVKRSLKLVPALFHAAIEALPPRRASLRKDEADPEEVRIAVDIVASLTDSQAGVMNRRFMGVATGSIADLLDT